MGQNPKCQLLLLLMNHLTIISGVTFWRGCTFLSYSHFYILLLFSILLWNSNFFSREKNQFSINQFLSYFARVVMNSHNGKHHAYLTFYYKPADHIAHYLWQSMTFLPSCIFIVLHCLLFIWWRNKNNTVIKNVFSYRLVFPLLEYSLWQSI